MPQYVPSSHDSTKACTVVKSFLLHALYNCTGHVSLGSSLLSNQFHFYSDMIECAPTDACRVEWKKEGEGCINASVSRKRLQCHVRSAVRFGWTIVFVHWCDQEASAAAGTQTGRWMSNRSCQREFHHQHTHCRRHQHKRKHKCNTTKQLTDTNPWPFGCSCTNARRSLNGQIVGRR
uniref:Uncharacterized protein n=1 Tax=Craspedostauros australis TaxID=1486917 RepID=A0A7R9ZPB1_9STRA|mmetsp:Transcript_2639/g.7328  ORF Transcript_2639/g.7328 Transcript_2639/m.7328 type:complete len:177 (+) Transcript_2639:509-1039(+)